MDWNRVGVLKRLFGGGDWQIPTTVDGRDPAIQARYQQELRRSKQASLWDQPLSGIRYVIVDTETTGFQSTTDHLLCLAAVEVQGARVTGRFFQSYAALPSNAFIPNMITELTEITADDLEGAPLPHHVIQDFLKFLNGDVLIGHHIRHDVSFINAYLRRQGCDELEHRILDTAVIFRWLQKLPQTPTLESLISHYHLPAEARHTALGDASLTAKVWQNLLMDVHQRGIITLGNLLEEMLFHR